MYQLEVTFGKTFVGLRKVLNDRISYEMVVHKLKFALYIVFLVAIFVLLWTRMVINMRMDISKALGILNVLPTSHLAANLAFIKEMNRSSLIN